MPHGRGHHGGRSAPSGQAAALTLSLWLTACTSAPQSFDGHLQRTFFDPLDLAMTVDPRTPDPRQATGYRSTDGQFEVAVSNWQLGGPAGLHTTPTELVRWGDNYRTGTVGGSEDRSVTVAVACNTDIAPWPITEALLRTWAPN